MEIWSGGLTMYVLDSSALIELFEGTQQHRTIRDLIEGKQLVTTSICVHEVLVGAHHEKENSVLEDIFSSMHVLDFTVPAAKISALIVRGLSREGNLIGRMDILIAAICRAHDATLVTLDKDFLKIKDLKVHVVS